MYQGHSIKNTFVFWHVLTSMPTFQYNGFTLEKLLHFFSSLVHSSPKEVKGVILKTTSLSQSL